MKSWITENLAGYPTPAEGTWRVEHVQATFQIGNVLGAVNDDAGAFGVSAEFVFPVAKFLAPGSGEGAAQGAVVVAGEVETDFSVVFLCHISRDSSVVKVAL